MHALEQVHAGRTVADLRSEEPESTSLGDASMPCNKCYGEYLQDAEDLLQGYIRGIYRHNEELGPDDIDALKSQVEALRQARLRYEQGVYGLCSVCGETMDWATRRAFPHATVCCRCDPLHIHLYRGRAAIATIACPQ
jgi:hypothetical protein